MIKTYKFPKTEIWSFFFLDTVAAIFILMAIKNWRIEEFSFPLYLMLINFAMVLLIVSPRKRGALVG